AMIVFRGKELLIALWIDERVLRFVLRRKALATQSALGGHEGSLPRSSHSKCTKSRPPVESRLVLSGPWSLEWL
ncbi:hypothetical protein A2U01_0076624, partial [Trifolium medium]|nr:hypothetical protein [Trifolium medium]